MLLLSIWSIYGRMLTLYIPEDTLSMVQQGGGSIMGLQARVIKS